MNPTPGPPPEALSETASSMDGWVPVLYEELRRIARRERFRLFAGETFATTALINEAYIRLTATLKITSRAQFLGTAAMAMHSILVDRIRAQMAQKRGGGIDPVPIEGAEDFVVEDGAHVLEVHDALERLAALSPRLAQVVECRFFAGYDEAQTAEALGASLRTVQRDWATARAWLKKELAA